MAVSISDSFDDKGFLLDEVRLRKLAEVMSKRLGEPVLYFIARKDQSQFDTANIDDVLSESNSGSTAISRLQIVAVGGIKNVNAQVTFRRAGYSHPVELELRGEDRELASLIAGDIREYVDSEIITKPFHTRWLSFPAAVVFAYLLKVLFRVMGLGPFGNDAISEETALKSSDLAVKLNYLIRQNEGPNNLLGWTFILLLMVCLAFVMWLLLWNPQWDLVNPNNLFLIGKEQLRYQRLVDLRGKLFWGVIIASVVSVLTGVIVLQIAKP